MIIFMSLPLLLLFTTLSVKGYLDSRDRIDVLNREVGDLRQKVAAVQQSKNLVKDDIDIYNELLARIVPEKEDYFSMILALERLSQKTGFLILRYNINLGKSTKEKIALVIEGDGSADEFLKFLEDYQYGGGRLITIEKMEFTTSEVGKIKLSLNFYNKKLPSVLQPLAKITQKDVELLNQIKEKTSVVLKDTPPEPATNAPVDNYEVDQNPF